MPHLVVADLVGREDARVLVQGALHLLPVLGGGRLSDLLLNAPRGDGALLRVPAAVRVETPADLLTPEELAVADDWVLDASFRIVDACDPVVRYGHVNMAALYLCMLQDWLHEYALMALSLRTQLRRRAGMSLTVFSPDPFLAGALEADLRADGLRVRRTAACRVGHGLHALVDRTRHASLHRGARAGTAARPITESVRALPAPDVLLVSESRPMEQMFAACVPSLRASGLEVLQLQLGPPGRRSQADAGCITALSPADPAYPGHGIESPTRELPDVPLPPLPDGMRLSPTWRTRLARRMQYLLAVKRRYVDDLRTALAELRPRAIAVGNDRWWVGQAVVQVARELGIPTVALQDGIMFALPRCWWLAADVGAVNGRHMFEALAAHGVPHERLALVGQPRYDARPATLDRAAARAALHVPREARLVLVATQPDQSPIYAAAVVRTLLDRGDVQVILRPHPSMDAAPLRAVADAVPSGRVRLDGATPIEQQLAAADLVVVQNSTLCVEAALAGVPVITCTLNGLPDLVPYGTLGLATAVRSLPELRRALDAVLEAPPTAVLSDAERQARIEHLIGPLDGRSAERFAELMARVGQRARADAC
jgi:hypothetical protein